MRHDSPSKHTGGRFPTRLDGPASRPRELHRRRKAACLGKTMPARKRTRSMTLADALAEESKAARLDTLRGPDSAERRARDAAGNGKVARSRNERAIALATLAKRSGIRLTPLSSRENRH